MPEPGPAPDLSVVVASFCGGPLLDRCLSSLEREVLPPDRSAEIVVATTENGGALASARAAHPRARFVPCDPGADVFALRAAGVKASNGRLVALTEDHATLSPGWMALLLSAHAAGHEIAGGPVDNGLTGAYGWALYLCEYGIHMPPLPGGEAPVLSGLNIAYARPLLERTASIWASRFHENEVNAPLLAEGWRLWAIPGATALAHLPMRPGAAMRHLFTGARRYGSWRARLGPTWKRAALVLASPLVPAVLLARIARRILARQPGRLWYLALGLPFVACLLGAWSLGEALGYLAPSGVLLDGIESNQRS